MENNHFEDLEGALRIILSWFRERWVLETEVGVTDLGLSQ